MYECNQNCKCSRRCANRVVQNGLHVRLQLFKTKHKGWAVRTLHDIPKGAFISTYTGEIIDRQQLDLTPDASRAYMVDLNYIEMCEKAKELRKQLAPVEGDVESSGEDEDQPTNGDDQHMQT